MPDDMDDAQPINPSNDGSEQLMANETTDTRPINPLSEELRPRMSVETVEAKPVYFVQNRHSVHHGVIKQGLGTVKTVYLPGHQIPAGLLDSDEIARLAARGVISLKPPVQLPPAPGSNPANVGLQPGADARRWL